MPKGYMGLEYKKETYKKTDADSTPKLIYSMSSLVLFSMVNLDRDLSNPPISVWMVHFWCCA